MQSVMVSISEVLTLYGISDKSGPSDGSFVVDLYVCLLFVCF